MSGKRAEKDQKQPRKIMAFCVKTDTKTIKIELYPAEQWSGRPGAEPGRFRLKVGRSWETGNGKYTFYTMSAVHALVGRILRGCVQVEIEITRGNTCTSAQPIAKHTLVEAPDNLHGLSYSVRTMTKSFRGVDGEWYVFVMGQDDPLPVSSLTVLRASTRVP